jgi:hypothetical protein
MARLLSRRSVGFWKRLVSPYFITARMIKTLRPDNIRPCNDGKTALAVKANAIKLEGKEEKETGRKRDEEPLSPLAVQGRKSAGKANKRLGNRKGRYSETRSYDIL